MVQLNDVKEYNFKRNVLEYLKGIYSNLNDDIKLKDAIFHIENEVNVIKDQLSNENKEQ